MQRKRNRRNKQSWVGNLALAVGSLIFFIAVLEIFLRVTGIETTEKKGPPIYQKSDNPLINYELKPNVHEKAYRAMVTTNSLGFRGPEIDTTKKLIAILGDSIAFGYGVKDDEALSEQLAKLMPQYHFLNAAVPGYGITQEIATYDTKVKDLDPTAVILMFYFNDLTTSGPDTIDEKGILRSPTWKPGDDQCDPRQNIGALWFIPGSCWLNDHSTIFIKLRKVANLIASRSTASRRQVEAEKEANKEAVDYKVLEYYETQLDELSELLPEDTARIFVIIPDFIPRPKVTPQLIRIAKERGFSVVNLYEPFPKPLKNLGWDLHPHEDAIKQVAEYMAEQIEEKNLFEDKVTD